MTSQIESQRTTITGLEKTIDTLRQQLRVALQAKEQNQGLGKESGQGLGQGSSQGSTQKSGQSLDQDHQTPLPSSSTSSSSSTQQRNDLLRNKQKLEEKLEKCRADGRMEPLSRTLCMHE